MNRIRPRVTGLFIGLAITAWGGLEGNERPPVRALRWSLVGLGLGVFATHTLQRIDELIDSKRSARSKKLRILARAIEQQHGPKDIGTNTAESDIFEKSLGSTIHFSPESFSDTDIAIDTADDLTGENGSSIDSNRVEVALPVAFEAACQDKNFLRAFEIYQESLNEKFSLGLTSEILAILRSDALSEIFQRMHSGTVKVDIAQLASLIVELFPESKEGHTLGPVLGVLRRSAGLCPRCSRPYKGIANACHECLKGTSEAYQIAWDDEPE